MEIRSLGYRTDLIFHRSEGVIADRGHYLVVRTPSNPSFYWGNFLLFRDPPGAGALPVWKQLFEEEIASRQPTGHFAFGWDSPEGEPGELDPFLAEGFLLDESVVLATGSVIPPPRYNSDAVIRPLASNADWQQVLENQIACRPPGFSLERYRPYKTRRMEHYRRMADVGQGAWFGAFLEDRLVADLGLFIEGTVARFQAVETQPEFRRQGLCGTLVYESSRVALGSWGAERLVMAADEHYHAARIYESLGFRPVERQLGVELRLEV